MDEWVLEEKATVEDEVLTIQGEKTKYKLSQAVHFTADVGDGTDPHKLVGRVKEIDRLLPMGAEHYMDSVLIEDSAYQVTPGFTGECIFDDMSKEITQQSSKGEKKAEDRELLAKFLLDNL